MVISLKFAAHLKKLSFELSPLFICTHIYLIWLCYLKGDDPELFNSYRPWWRHQIETFSALLAFCAVNSPHQGQCRGALMFSLICAWTNAWVNNRDAGDLRRHGARYDVSYASVCAKFSVKCVLRESCTIGCQVFLMNIFFSYDVGFRKSYSTYMALITLKDQLINLVRWWYISWFLKGLRPSCLWYFITKVILSWCSWRCIVLVSKWS